MGKKVVVAAAQFLRDDVGVANVFGGASELKRHQSVEPGSQTGDEPPLLRLENERAGGGPSELRDMFHVAKAKRGFPSFVELHKEPRSLPAERLAGMIVFDHF